MDTTSMSAVDIIGELLASEGAADYPGEPVTQAAHTACQVRRWDD